MNRSTLDGEAESLRERILAQVMQYPSPLKSAEELTDAERVALCIAAGIETYTTMEENVITFHTKRPVGIVKIDGKFKVYEYRGVRMDYSSVQFGDSLYWYR